MQQARVMQKLQADNKKIGAYKSTVKFQEKVIAKLENLLESKMKENATGAAGGMQLARLKKQVEHLTRRNQELEKNGAAASHAAAVVEGAHIMDDDTVGTRVGQREREREREKKKKKKKKKINRENATPPHPISSSLTRNPPFHPQRFENFNV